MAPRFADPAAVMRRALELAARGIGWVEPNPPVGAILVDEGLEFLAEGYHRRFGGPHAEVDAIDAASGKTAGATLFVMLEPCCHQGKTGPCTEAILRAGIRRVVVAMADPYSEVNGRGIKRLREAGVDVEVGLLEDEAARLLAPFTTLVTAGRPWVHAKWAMTLDGKIATSSGDSKWISSETSRGVVHQLRGRMDAILVGAGTAAVDDPLLTARPPGPRVATRIVVDSRARLSPESQLVRTAREAPLLIVVTDEAPDESLRRLRDLGVEVWKAPRAAEVGTDTAGVDLPSVLAELGRRKFTNLLVEGGSRLLGSFADTHLIDEVHVFLAPKLAGGSGPSAVGGTGTPRMELAERLESVSLERLENDVYLNGRLQRH